MVVKNHIRFILVVFVLSVCIIFVYRSIFITPNETQNPHKEFPNRVLNWIADEVVYDKEALSSLSPDKIIYKTYKRDENNEYPPITLFLACYNTLEKADLSHSPIVCFTGQGWEIENTKKLEISLNQSKAQKIRVNAMIQKKLDTNMITLFWYQSANRAFNNRGIQKVSLFFNKILGKSDNNAFVRITVTIPEEMPIEETTSYLLSFVQDMYPELRRFFL